MQPVAETSGLRYKGIILCAPMTFFTALSLPLSRLQRRPKARTPGHVSNHLLSDARAPDADPRHREVSSRTHLVRPTAEAEYFDENPVCLTFH